jgi:predicted metalloprotease
MVPFDNPTRIVLSAGDLDEAVSGFLDLSDDPNGETVVGTAFQRFDAFSRGFLDGSAACLE